MTDEGFACRFCVESVEIARQIIFLLSRGFAFQTSDPMQEGVHPAQRTFRIAYGSQLCQQDLVRLLSPLTGLRLQVVQAAKQTSRSRQS